MVKRFHIGMQRSGSTFLYNLLKGHSQISVSPLQEIHYFTKNDNLDLEFYESLFPENKKYKIDTSPKYFKQSTKAATRIKNYCELEGITDPKILIVLRDPIEYIYSNWQMHINQGHFDRSESYKEVPNTIDEFITRYPNYLRKAYYFNIIQEWMNIFDKDSIKVITFEDLVSKKDDTLKDILEFFEIPFEPLKTTESSMNSQLRSKFLYNLRNIVVQNSRLKGFIKSSKLFNYVYKKFLVSKKKIISKQEREFLKHRLLEDSKKLNELLNLDLEKKWSVFE